MDRMAPPGMMPDSMPEAPAKSRMAPPGESDKPMEGKASREEAMVVDADRHCISCLFYDPNTGDCEKVEGSFSPDDACVKYFEPMSEEPDADDMGNPDDATGIPE